MKLPTMLLERVLLDVGLQLVDTIDLDYREICRRYENEGMSFLTITLPTLDDALLKGLSRGHLTCEDFKGFRPMSRHGSLPALLSGFFRRVFHSDGSIMEEPDVCAIFAIRQVTRLFKKVELPCSNARVKAAYERYLSNDREVDWRSHRTPMDGKLFSAVCDILWSDLEVFSEELYCSPGIFGRGATAERVKRNERHSIKQWPERAENHFPSSYHAVHREDSEALAGLEFITEEQEQPVRVVQVPKTLKTPRTISVEPSYMMLMQQSIARPLMVYLESKRFGYRSICFTDQTVNANLARLGSLDGSLATIDLKDASDMVDNDLVREIFERPCPTFYGFVQACRSTRAQMPDGTIVPLRKFASMGSALCFPIEAMVFFTIIMYSICKESGIVPSRRALLKIAKHVAVYGDDIIVDSSMASVVMERLEDFGLKVNRDKSFLTGLFRESCGGDYYAGVNVTPTYVRHWDDSGTLRDSSQKVAYVSLSNTLYVKGLWHACQYLRDEISVRFKTRIPLSQHPIGVLHFSSFMRSDGLSYDSKLHGYRVRGYRVRAQTEMDAPCDMGGFLSLSFSARCFEQRLGELESHLSRTYDPERVLGQYLGLDGDFGKPKLHEYRFGIDPDGSPDGTPVELQLQSPSASPGYGRDRGFLASSEELSGAANAKLHRAYPSETYGSILSQSRRDTRMENLRHLISARGSRLDASDRPHALCLKRGWTASPAGLVW